MRFTLNRESYIDKDSTPITRDGIDAVVYIGISKHSGRLHGTAFRGKAQKPSWNYIFRDEASRQRSIDSFFDDVKTRADFMAERQESRRNAIRLEVQVGDLFYTSWGYDQTNYDYMVVVEVSKTGKTVTCRMVDQIGVGTSGQSDVITPGCATGKTFKMQVRDTCLVGSYPFCNDNAMRSDHFFPTSIGETHHQTNPVFGH